MVIGAGMGGLAAAIHLARGGMRVTVLERASTPGGKMRQLVVAGQSIDAGPTVFTMRWVFEELFASAGETFSDHVQLHPATTLARHAWPGEKRLDLFADRKRSADAIGTFSGAADAKGYLAFCDDAARIYRTLDKPFIRAKRPSMSGLVAAAGPISAMRLKPFSTLWSAIGSRMKDPRLQQMFARYSTYCGTSPFNAPATLMLVAHVEQEGVWLVQGGMQRVAEAMAALALRQGVTIRYDADVKEIMTANSEITGVRLDPKEVIRAQAVVLNGEPTALANGILGRKLRSAAELVPFERRSLSAVTWALTARTAGMPLLRHNVFFSSNYKREFDLIRSGLLPTEPTTYICAQDRTDVDGPAIQDQERLLMLINAPASGDRRAFSQVEIDQCMQGMSALLQKCGLQMELATLPVMTTPATFHRLFPASGGALYGQAVNGSTASFERPNSRTTVKNLYLAGGSTHPGAGVPMAAISGRRAAEAVLKDLAAPRGLMGWSRKTATPGGTSTP